MMQAIKHLGNPAPAKWYLLSGTTSTSASMAFDRLRMMNNQNIEVGIIDPAISVNYAGGFGKDSKGFFLDGEMEVEQIQPFHSGGGWTALQDEHDFSFDCSGFQYGNGNDGAAAIVIRNLSESSLFWQLYAYPTGYGGTRNKDAQIKYLYFDTLRMGDNGAEIPRLRLTNQNDVFIYNYVQGNPMPAINALEVRLEGTSVFVVDPILEALVASGRSNGTLSYDVEDRPDNDQGAQNNYDTLITRGWSITGGRPVV
jgi:hypothetical protein